MMHQQLPQQLPARSENPQARIQIMRRVIVEVHQQLPQQLPARSENPQLKIKIMGRVIVGS